MTNKKAYSKKQVVMRYAGTWLEPATHEALKSLAREDDRSLSAFIKQVLEREVESHKPGYEWVTGTNEEAK